MSREETAVRSRRAFDRRSFLKIAGALGVGAIAGGVIQSVFDVVSIGRGLLKVSQTRIAMGTYVTITAIHESRGQAEEAIGRTFEEMERFIAVLTRHDAASPVSVLNQEGSLSDMPMPLREVLEGALHFNRVTGGAFDVTVKPLVDLVQETVGRGAEAPTDNQIEAVLGQVGSEHIELSPNQSRVRFGRPGMGVTLDGIAKGYIVDMASRHLWSQGIHNHLINAGGDIRTRGTRANGKPWRIAVEDPDKRGNYPDVIRITDGSVATSGNYEVYFDQEKVFHHIVDPRSGRSPTHNAGVTVLAESVAEADALSTAVYVLPPAEGAVLIDSLDRTECLVLDTDGKQYRTRGWKAAAGEVG